MTSYELKLAPLPCWKSMARDEIRKRVTKMVAEIETAAAKLREKVGASLVGMNKIRHQDPLEPPTRSKRSPKPPCHAASKDMRERFRQTYRAFAAMFQEASLKIKFDNIKAAIFPKGSFPPSLPFVRTGEEFDQRLKRHRAWYALRV